MIDNSRVGVSFARKRTVGGRRGGGGGSYNNGGDRYSRGGDYDSSRNRRRYSPRQSDDMRDRIKFLMKIIMIDEDDILDHVVQFNIINVIIVHDQDHHHQNVVIDNHQEIDLHNNKHPMLFIDMKKAMIKDLIH